MPAQFMKLGFTDADELCAAASSWDIEYQQLDKGPASVRLERLESAGVSVSRLHLTSRFHQRGTASANALTFGLPDDDAMHSWMGKPVRTSTLLNFSRVAEFESVSRPGFLAHSVSLSDDLYQKTAKAVGVGLSAQRIRRATSDFILPTRKLAVIKRAATEWLDYCADPGDRGPFAELNLQDDLLISLMAGIGEATASDKPTQISHRQYSVGRALDYIHSTHGPVLVRDVYEQSLASWRTLDRGFMERFGVGPKKYITATRMLGTRRTLLATSPDTKIADIANDWGFLHHGRFAEDYRSMFGELPSETKRS